MGKKNESKVDYWLTEEGLALIKGWARNTFTKKELAEKIGIAISTLEVWCEKYKEIEEAVKTNREIADFMVENAILKAALGYRTKEVKVTIGKKVIDGQTVEMLKETVEKEVPPNINAAIFWLNNRKFDDWKRNRDKVVEVDPDDQQVTITIQRGKNKVEVLDDGDEVNESVTYSVSDLNDAENSLDDENEENEYDDDEWEDEDWE